MKTKIFLLIIFATTFLSCKKEKNSDPVVSTYLANSLSAFTCYVKAQVSEKGSYDILDYGFIYSQSNSSLSIDYGTKISLGKTLATDTFSTTIALDNYQYLNSIYYVRAYLTNTKGTVYGSILSFQPLVLSVYSVFPFSGKVGDSITIIGNNFSSNPNDNFVKFNSTIAKVLKATTTKIIVAVPSGIQIDYYGSNIVIYVGKGFQQISASNFSLQPSITDFSPKTGSFDTNITLTGENLYGANVTCNDINAYVYLNTNTSLAFSIPNFIKSEVVKFKVVKNNIATEVDGYFTLNPISISSVNLKKGYVGTTIFVTGVNFNPDYNYASLKVGGVKVTNIDNISSTYISGQVPSLSVGTYDIEVNNGISSSILSKAFTVITP